MLLRQQSVGKNVHYQKDQTLASNLHNVHSLREEDLDLAKVVAGDFVELDVDVGEVVGAVEDGCLLGAEEGISGDPCCCLSKQQLFV